MPWADNRSVKAEYVRVTYYPPQVDMADALLWAESLAMGGFEYEDGENSPASFTDIPLEPGRPFVRLYVPRERAHKLDEIFRICAERDWELQVEHVQAEDWANSWKAYYTPVSIAQHYVVVPAWYENSPESGDRTLWLDPGMAFGTGTHATTQMCLNALATMDVVGKRLLDLGAGSGILGLFGALRGTDRAVLVEPDPVAVRAIFHNARLNRLEQRVRVVPGTLADLAPELFDVLCLNLIWDIIASEWPRLQQYLAPGATVLVSGLLPEREADMRELAYETGHRVIRIQESEGWLMVILTDDSASD